MAALVAVRRLAGRASIAVQRASREVAAVGAEAEAIHEVACLVLDLSATGIVVVVGGTGVWVIPPASDHYWGTQ